MNPGVAKRQLDAGKYPFQFFIKTIKAVCNIRAIRSNRLLKCCRPNGQFLGADHAPGTLDAVGATRRPVGVAGGQCLADAFCLTYKPRIFSKRGFRLSMRRSPSSTSMPGISGNFALVAISMGSGLDALVIGVFGRQRWMAASNN